MGLQQGLRWDHLPWPHGLTCRHPSDSHAAITWGWPQHTFVYPGVKMSIRGLCWICLRLPGPKVQISIEQSPWKSRWVESALWFCPMAANYIGHEPLRGLMTWAASWDSGSFSLTPLHFLKGFLPSQGVVWCREVRLAPWFGYLRLWGSGPQWFPPVPCRNGKGRSRYPEQRLQHKQELSQVLCSV